MKNPVKLPARCGLSALSGMMYAGAFPPLDQGWMVFPGVAGLLLAIRGESGSRARLLGLVHGFAAFGISLSWLWNLFGTTAIFLWCVLALFTGLFADMQGRAVAKGIGGYRLAVFTAANWCALEFIRGEIFPLKLPWMTAGLAMGPNVLLPWVGVYGVGFVVLFSVGCAFSSKRIVASVLAGLVFVGTFFWKPRPEAVSGEDGSVAVAGLQLEGVSMTEFLRGTEGMRGVPDHVVWPEYSVPFDVRENERDWNLLLDLCREERITLTFGTQARPGGGDEWRNIALTMDGTGALGEHTKNHTVHFFDDGTPGEIAVPVDTPHGKVGTPICFDMDYADVARAMTAAGAEYFVVPTMDAESWSARQHDQHAELARVRAAENGRWVFVVATSGVSQLIDSAGHVHERLGAMRQGRISGILKREKGLTAYTRVGWMFPWSVLGGAVICWILVMLPVRKRREAAD